MRTEVEAWLRDAVRRLAELGVERVLLFGSWARGTATRRSDLDLLVVWATDLPPLARIGRVLDLLRDAPVPVEPLVYTPAELADRGELPFLRSVLREARLLYERGEAAARGAGSSGCWTPPWRWTSSTSPRATSPPSRS